MMKLSSTKTWVLVRFDPHTKHILTIPREKLQGQIKTIISKNRILDDSSNIQDDLSNRQKINTRFFQ